jgi:hypothetical protein
VSGSVFTRAFADGSVTVSLTTDTATVTVG